MKGYQCGRGGLWARGMIGTTCSGESAMTNVRMEDAEPDRGRTNGGTAPDEDETRWPVIDAAAYHGFAGEVVRVIGPHSEADPVGLLIQLLTCTGNIVGRRRHYRHESSRHHPNLFGALVGQTSKGRKGTSLERIRDVIKTADSLWNEERSQSGLSSGEGLIHVVRDLTKKWDKESR